MSEHATSENKDNHDYFIDNPNIESNRDYLIPQCDGNDSIEEIDDAAIANVESITNIQTKVANFELNRAKQTAGIYRDAQNQDFKLFHKDQDKNINIECNSGFYAQVAKPTICSLSQDYIPPVLGHTIICDNITKNLDALGSEYNLTLFFKISPEKGRGMKVTIHTHNSTRLVQVQGGALMADKTTAALWFVKNVLYGKFQVLAKSRRYNISSFNNAIIDGVASFPLDPTKMKCGGCDILFDSRSKPIFCPKCTKWFHKTNCQKGHRCFLLTPVATDPVSSTSTVSPPLPLQSTLHPPPQPSNKTVVTRASTPTTISVSSSLSSSLPPSTSSLALITVPPVSPTTNSQSLYTLNPGAQQFIPATLSTTAPPPHRPRRTKPAQNNPDLSPRKAEIESLKIELGYAHTKIAELHSRNHDHQETIKIYSQKLKLLEKGQSDYLNEKYFSSSSDMSSSSDCPCQTKLKISKNTEKLKNLELKLNQELDKINNKLDGHSITAPSPPSSPRLPSSSHPSPPTSQPSNRDPETLPSSQSKQTTSHDLMETISEFTFDNLHNNDNPGNDEDDNHDYSESTQPSDSDFEFSDSFEPPEISPQIPLN